MGFFSNLLGRSEDNYEYEAESTENESPGIMPELYSGMKLEVETAEGEEILCGRISGYTEGDTTLTLERLPGGLSFKIRDIGTTVILRGYYENLSQFVMKGTIQESTRLVCRVKDVKMKPFPEQRQNFRLRTNCTAALYLPSDEGHSNPEECTLIDISTGGACLESEYLHGEDEVLRLKLKLEDYVPMEFTGEIIRVVEMAPGKFRYGFLFAQLQESEMTDLTRTLYNIQVGNKLPWTRHGQGHW